MFSTREFARIGLVSVRMLRNYEFTGLLQPTRVDASGRRFYEADQLPRLNRILALKDLGFTLEQVRTILDAQVSGAELHGMLQLRQTELAARIAADTARLERVEARLRTIASEGYVPGSEVVTKDIKPVRIAELAAIADGYAAETLGRVIRPLQSELTQRMSEAGLAPDGPAIAYYDAIPGSDGDTVTVHAAYPVKDEPDQARDFTIADLPGAGPAATLIHHGPMSQAGTSFEALARWIDVHGYTSAGYMREVYLDCPSDAQDRWVTELQMTIEAD
ncbi:MAG TPA: MerR family transcriptional regulator [Streptosporangiaceae bacterium]|jgi:DNA-binding transcriptional MerR regulator|nr:MerR family transcriptional regulator [Streptosporangiaceae bacterium]